MTIYEFGKYVKKLEGYNLNGVGRCADMLWVSMIEENNSLIKQEYILHIQCPWRLKNKDTILIASYDMYIDENDQDIDQEEFNSIFDNNLNIIKNRNLKIVNMKISNLGDIKMLLSNGWVFETFTNTSSKIEENWRLIKQEMNKDNIHYVFPEDFI